jgi:hypothetical protein
MFKKIYDSLSINLPSFNYDATNDFVFVRHDFDQFILIFKVEYERHYTNILEATYDSQEEFDIEYEFKEVLDVAIYEGDENFEASPEELNKIYELITKQL